MTGSSEEAKQYLRKGGGLLRRWEFILDFEIEKHRDDSVEVMNREIEKARV